MKIKRYTGTNTREVLARIRNDLGPDAVILSNREIVGGVELMAAVDFDANHLAAEPAPAPMPAPVAEPAPAPQPRAAAPAPRRAAPVAEAVRPWQPAAAEPAPAPVARPAVQPAAPAAAAWGGDLGGLRDELKELRQWVQANVPAGGAGYVEAAPSPVAAQLQALGFSAGFAQRASAGAIDAAGALSACLGGLRMPAEPMAADGVYALVGATGVGKTTTIAKIAARLVLRHGTSAVALVTTDTYRIGGVEQLKIYGRILGVPVAVARDAGELEQHLQAFADRRFVLIDTIGLSPRDARLVEQMQWLQGFGDRITRLLLLNAGMSAGFYAELWKLYRQLPVAACVLTKLDETPTFGAAVQWLLEQGLPLWFYTDGQRVPEDLHVPSIARMSTLLRSEIGELVPAAFAGRQMAGLAAER